MSGGYNPRIDLTGIDLKGIDWEAPAVDVSDDVLERVQAGRRDLDFDAQMDLHDQIVGKYLR